AGTEFRRIARDYIDNNLKPTLQYIDAHAKKLEDIATRAKRIVDRQPPGGPVLPAPAPGIPDPEFDALIAVLEEFEADRAEYLAQYVDNPAMPKLHDVLVALTDLRSLMSSRPEGLIEKPLRAFVAVDQTIPAVSYRDGTIRQQTTRVSRQML